MSDLQPQPDLVTRLEFDAERAAVAKLQRDRAALIAALVAGKLAVPPLESQ